MTFLDKILASRTVTIEDYKRSSSRLEESARGAPSVRDFKAALKRPGMSLIAEIKRRSPSKGDLAPDLDPAELASSYERGGAHAISVLTEPEFFGGSDADLRAARAATSLPVLWKDFVLDRSQLVAARASGADAVLLIVRILGPRLAEFIDEAKSWSLCPLVEGFDERDVEAALSAGADVIGVTNRDLETFAEDPTATKRLRAQVPEGVTYVAESAISTRKQVVELENVDVDAILVGEALVRSDDPGSKVAELLGA